MQRSKIEFHKRVSVDVMYPCIMATIRDVARHAEVSPSVVSAVMNGSRYVRVSKNVRERVLQAIDDMDYVPNHAARSLSLARSGAIAVVIPSISNPIYEDMRRGIHDAAESSGHVVFLTEAHQLHPGSDLFRRLVNERRVDGFLIRMSGHVQMLEELAKHKIAVVSLDSDLPGHRWGRVYLDNHLGTTIATNHLLELGHKRLAFIGGHADNPPDKERQQAFREALRAAGLRNRNQWVSSCGYTPESGHQALTQMLQERTTPTGVVVNNVTTALGVIAAAHDCGLAIPDELSVIGYHDIPTAAIVRPEITTVRMPLYELGYKAQEMLTSILSGEPPREITITEPAPHVILRGSTAPAR